MTRKKHSHPKLIRDLAIVVASVFVAVAIIKIGILENILAVAEGVRYLSSFVAGLFFTSLFTIAPASVALAKLSETTAPVGVALCGAAGAMVGDLILFLFIRDSLAEDVIELIKTSHYKRIISVFKLRIFRWLVPFLGALVIVSPLPDEIGLSMMGFSKIPTVVMMPLTFLLNFIGILLICFVAGTL